MRLVNNKIRWALAVIIIAALILTGLYFYPSGGLHKSAVSVTPVIVDTIRPAAVGAHTDKPTVAVASASSSSQFDPQAAYEQWLALLQTSTRPVDKISSIIVGKDAAKNIITLQSLLEADPQNLLLHYLLAQNCLWKFNADVCKPIRQSALAIFASDNGLVDDLKFIEAHRQNNPEAALAALNEGGRTAHTDNFYGEQFALVTESMEAVGFKHDMHMIEAAIGVMAAENDNIYSDMMKLCKQQTQRQWQDACSARGIALAEYSINDYPQMIGLQLIKGAGRTNDPRYEKLAAQYHQYQTEMEESLDQWESARTSGFQLTDNQWQEFLVICQTQGEAAAKRYLLALIK